MFKIAHISDVHIRPYKRHDEYRQHFNNLYLSLKEKKPSCIVLTGDILHDKSQISIELVDILIDFLTSLSSIAQLYLIAGNHDMVIKNASRLDAINPIIKALNNNNIHYFKKSGIYPVTISNISFNFVVFSCFENKDIWTDMLLNINSDILNIGLYHGMIDGCYLANNQVANNDTKLSTFLNKVDYLLLGDIHGMQILDLNYRAAYAGSTIQQNYGEDTNKGYLLWNIESKTHHSVDFINLPNVCPFYTLRLQDDLKIPSNLNWSKKCKIRVFSRQLSYIEKDNLEEELYRLFNPLELIFIDDLKARRQELVIGDTTQKAENLQDLIVQEKIFKSFFKERNLPEEKIEEIIVLNKKFSNFENNENEIIRNIQYKVGKIKFSNLFSFGENNEFDFSQFKGIVGIFGNSGSGKSSLAVDIPLYTIFNKISKKGVVKNDLLINENKNCCLSEIELFLNDEVYIIKRDTCLYLKSGKKLGEPQYQGKTEVDFKIIKSNGTEENKNAEERTLTDKSIKQIFGTCEDFIETCISPQWNLLGIIDAGGTERQKLIGKYFDIDIFEHKHKLAKEEFKYIKFELEKFNFDKLQQEKNKILAEITALENKCKEVKQKKEDEKFFLIHLDEKYSKYKEFLLEKTIEKKSIENNRINVLNNIKFLISKIQKLNDYPCISNSNCCLLNELNQYKIDKQSQEIKLNNFASQICEVEKDLKDYSYQLDSIEQEKRDKEKKYSLSGNDIETLSLQVQSLKFSLNIIEEQLSNYKKLSNKHDIYVQYLEATSKDGISKRIISKNLNIINQELKKILSNSVNFEIELQSTDDGKAIEIYFRHQRNKPRRIELTSGAEKVLAAVALRAALVFMTTLPKPNIFILDEVSFLDNEYLNSFVNVLNYLKQMFDAVYIVTHINELKSACDVSIEIARDADGYSKINVI